MFTPKLDLHKSEWLELVFDDRNKAYGAYELRKHSDKTLLKALGFSILAFACLFEGYNIYLQNQPKVEIVMVDTTPPIVVTPPTVKPPVIPQIHHDIQPPANNNTTVKFVQMVATDDPQSANPPSLDKLETETIGPADHKGNDGPTDINVTPISSEGSGAALTEDKSIHTINTLEIMPQFPGGEAAWQKFLQKNLHYPGQALDAGVGGKVYISFVIEKDGHLTDITVSRGAGYGLDEEALRVMKIAPPWSPGIQNGQKVRVRYMMPFNFQVPTDNN